MWEIATLGNIPTSTYFVARVAFSLGRDGGVPRGAFLPHSPCAPLRCPPQQLEPLGTIGLLRLHPA